MLKGLAILGIVGVSGLGQAIVITQWNFNSILDDGSTTTGTLTPSIGVGTASLVGGTTATFASGNTNFGSTDPVGTNDSAWNTTTYATTAPNESAGAQFLSSTLGYEDIVITLDLRKSNTASRYLQFQYTTDGAGWNDFGGVLDQNDGEFWFNNNVFDLSGIGAVENNSNFGFRMVAALSPAGGYLASEPGSTFGSTGTIRYDMVTMNGATQSAPVPEPGSMAALGIAALVVWGRQRRK